MKQHAIIFDMDGVLIDSEQTWKTSLAEIYRELGIDFEKDMGADTMGMRVDEATQYWYKKFQWEGPTVPQVVDRIMERVIYYVKKDGEAMPGSYHALKVSNDAGAKTAIASSSYMKIIQTVVEVLDFGPFDAVHSAEHDHKGKPAPDVYIRTGEVLGVPPELCIVIEDSPKGIRAAKAAGMKCIGVPDPRWVTKEQAKDAGADVVINSLEEFSVDLVKSLY